MADSDTTEDTQQTEENDEIVTLTRAQIRSMERDAKEAKALRREMAFSKAGIDTEKGAGKLALKSYDGEPTVEAVTAFAQEYGLLDSPTDDDAPAEPDTPRYAPEETVSTEMRRATATGARADDTPDEHPSEVALRVGREVGQERDRETAMAAAIATKANAAFHGDKRALVAEPDRRR